MGRSAWIGAAIGAVLGASTVAFYVLRAAPGFVNSLHWPAALFIAAIGAAGGGVVGWGIGLLIGALISRKGEPRCRMAVESKLPGGGFWARWVLVSAVGFTASAFVGMCLAWAVVGTVPTGETTPRFFSMAYLDAMAGPWDPWHDLKYSAMFGPGGELFYWSVTIVLGGLTQWLVLRRHAERAVWWALPVPLAVAYHGVTADNPLTAVGGGVTLIAFHAKDFGILAALYSMIVGVPLVWFLRRSYRKAKRVGNASM